MACEDLVAGCFVDAAAPLAVPELNRERTLKFLECCYQQGLSWEDARRLEDCLARIARSIYIAASGRRVVVLHTFIKKTEKIRRRALEIARSQAREVA